MEKSKGMFPSMVEQKSQLQKGTAIALLVAFLLFLLLAGCKSKTNLPFYRFEGYPEAILIVDGVRYIEDTDIVRITNSAGPFWNFTGKTGKAIGICGGDSAEHGGGFDVCPIEGDENQNFFYVHTNGFVFGPYYIYFCIREDSQIMLPSEETVSSVGIVYYPIDGKDTLVQVDDPVMIAALFEAVNGDNIQTRNGDDWVYGSFTMQHKDYSFLQCEIEYCYSPEQEISYCQNADREWLPLPAEWYTVISEHDFSTREE